MKKLYIQPKAEVFELALDGLVMDNSDNDNNNIPGGGEIGIGGTGGFDAPSYRSKLWNDSENQPHK